MIDPRQKTPADHARATVSWWLFLARVGAVSVEVFLHKRFGSQYCRLQAFMVVPLAMIYGCLWNYNGYDIGPLVYFLGAYFGALVISQIGVFKRLRRGDQEHSYYNGYPWLLHESRAGYEKQVKLWLEPLMVVMIGYVVNDRNQPLGVYLMLAGCGLFLTNWLIHRWQRRQVVDLQDAVFEQRQTAGSFRSLHGG